MTNFYQEIIWRMQKKHEMAREYRPSLNVPQIVETLRMNLNWCSSDFGEQYVPGCHISFGRTVYCLYEDDRGRVIGPKDSAGTSLGAFRCLDWTEPHRGKASNHPVGLSLI